MIYLEKTYEFRNAGSSLKTKYMLYDLKNDNCKLKVSYYSDYVRIFNNLPIKNTSHLSKEEMEIL